MISPHRVSRFATGTSHGYPTDVPPGRARKSSVVRRGTTRGRGTGGPPAAERSSIKKRI